MRNDRRKCVDFNGDTQRIQEDLVWLHPGFGLHCCDKTLTKTNSGRKSFALAHVVKPIIEGSLAATLRAEPSRGRGEALLKAASLGLLGLFPYTAPGLMRPEF